MEENSSMLSSCRNSDDECRWVHREFLKEKLRVRERHWHPISSESSKNMVDTDVNETINFIIPDGLAWRTYLPLIIYLIEREEEHCKKLKLSVQHRTKRIQHTCLWVLLESVAEYMDHRSTSSTISADSQYVPPESPIQHERAKIQTLIQQHIDTVKVFCDLSVREGIGSDSIEDEWDLMQYDKMSMEDQSQNAILRAVRLLRQYRTDTTKNASRFFILSGDRNFVQRFPEEDGTRTILINDFLEILYSTFHRDEETDVSGGEKVWLTEEVLKSAKELAVRCEEDYILRNDPRRKAKSLSSVLDTGVEEYWAEDRILEGLRNKTLFKGKLNVTKENIKEAVVVSNSGAGGDSSSLFVNQAKGYFNRALHQDLVIVQLLPKEEWTSPVGKRRLIHVQSDGNDNSNINDAENVKLSGASPPEPSGRVIAIAKECRREFVATLVDTPMNDESSCLVVPMDVRIPKIRIKTNGWQQFLGQRLWVQVTNWELGSTYPSGRCVEMLGRIAELETEITCLLKENQIYLDPFSATAQACLPLEGHDWKIPSREISSRKDLRSIRRIFSVDPHGCQDIDDTFHAHILPNGDVEVGVHIADVTYFLSNDSALDKEARKRATTFYLVDRRFDMLPRVLSSDICSLHGNVDRLAVSTIWTMSKNFKIVKSFWYGRTVIRNYQAMTYEQAHSIIHNKPPDDPSEPSPPPLTAGYPVSCANFDFLRKDLSLLTELARKLRKDREDIGGAIDLSSGDHSNELKFSLDSDNNPVRVTPKKQLEIHQTVAELMIMANTWVAKTIFKRFPTCALLRIHRSVDESRFEDLKEILDVGKVSFDGSSNSRLADSLKKAEKSSKSNSAVNSLFKSLATRAMSEAQYVSTGELEGEEGLSHYGLGLRKYTHFTSPIRRYADVVVHRQLLLTLISKRENITRRPPPGFDRKVLDLLPKSKTISIIRGEGIVDVKNAEENIIDNACSSTQSNGNALSNDLKRNFESLTIADHKILDEYNTLKVSNLCKILNQQNRMAKLSSFECQRLFLSLYFKNHVEVTQAVVTNLRSNGFWAYIPKFDFRAPVYLSDVNGVVQIDPALFKLEASSGLDPTTGFSSSKSIRRYPSATCTLIQSSDDEHLEVTLQECTEKYELRVLNVVTVTIFCDDWNTKSRVPQPRIHLVANPKKIALSLIHSVVTDERPFANNRSEYRDSQNSGLEKTYEQKKQSLPSIYEEIEKLATPTNLSVEFRFSNSENLEKMKSVMPSKNVMIGRLIFGNFINPDTRSAQQEASIKNASAAALERRNQAMTSRTKENEYNTSRRIESDVTARMQRLAANKRNTKKGKSK